MNIIYFIIALLSPALLIDSAVADVFIDLQHADEINISNTQPDQVFTFKISELEVNTEQAIGTTPATIQSTRTLRAKQLPYHIEVQAAAKETLVDAALIHAVIATESRHNARAVSQKGARGLMQLMPATAKRFKVKDHNDAGQNILAGAKYLRELLTLYKGDLQLSLAAYNAGPGAVEKYHGHIPPYRETMRYVPKVLKYYRQYS